MAIDPTEVTTALCHTAVEALHSEVSGCCLSGPPRFAVGQDGWVRFGMFTAET